MKRNLSKREDFEARTLPLLDSLYHTALCLVDDELQAQELIQESFAEAYNSWLNMQVRPDCRVWLFRIMVTTLINQYRSSTDPNSGKYATGDADDKCVDSWPIDEQTTAASKQVPLSEITEDELKSAIKDLPRTFRLVVVLSLQAGFNEREIADITGMRLECVRARLHQAHKLMRESFWTMWRLKSATG